MQISRDSLSGYLSLCALVLTGACADGQWPVGPDDEAQVGKSVQALTATQPFERPNIYDFSATEREQLATAILNFITQPVLTEHANGHDWHHPSIGELFFTRHHDYLNQLEQYLLDQGLSQFVPVPEWDPGDPIPDELMVTDPLVSQAPLNQTPGRPIPEEYYDENLCKFETMSELAQDIESWHDGVHGAVGGAMGFLSQAPGAPIFWLWHGLLDDTYHERGWRCETMPAVRAAINGALL